MSGRRSIALWLVASGAITVLSWPTDLSAYRLIYNPTTSAPAGWYRISFTSDLNVADYVLVRLPREAARLANERQYLPLAVPLLKRIGAVREQRVCVSGNSVIIDGSPVAVALPNDSRGRNLVAWAHCRALESDELFLLSDSNPASFDSRYFGPIRLPNVIGKAIPVWTW